MLIRLELLTPQGDLVTADTYNRLFTQHGVVMIFFFLIPAIPAVFGNFVLPIQIGSDHRAHQGREAARQDQRHALQGPRRDEPRTAA